MIRFLLRDRTYLALSVLTMTLAVGATTAVSTVANALFWRPQPVAHPEQLVSLLMSGQPRDAARASERSLADRASWPVFSAVAGQAVRGDTAFDLAPHITLTGVTRELEAVGVTTNYFDVLGVPIRGRTFSESDNQYAAPPVAIISDELWTRAFRRDPEIIGRTIPASPKALIVVGIAAAGFRGVLRGERIEVWVPNRQLVSLAGISPDRLQGVGVPLLDINRMRDGVGLMEVRQAVAASRYGIPGPRGQQMEVTPINSLFGAGDLPVVRISEGPTLNVLIGLAALVAAGGALTLMGLILIHYERRRHEFSIRLALGASQRRLRMQLVKELGLMSLLGASGAVMAASLLTQLMPQFAFAGGVDLGRLDLGIDWRVIGAGVAACLVTISVAAIVPLSRLTSPSIDRSSDGHAFTASSTSIRLRQVVLGAHVATSVTVLLVAALLATSVNVGMTQGPGFDADHTVFLDMRAWSDRRAASYEQGRRDAGVRLQTLTNRALLEPGIRSVAIGVGPIGALADFSAGTSRPVDTSSAQRQLTMGLAFVGENYFATLDAPLISGVAPRRESEAVITTTLAQELWPGADAIGQRLKIDNLPEVEVVGTVEMAFGSLSRGRPPAVFIGGMDEVIARHGMNTRAQLVINAADPSRAATALDTLARDAFPDAPLMATVTGRQAIDRDLAPQRMGRFFLECFAAVALALSITGVFGLVTYLARSRRREFGVKLALGATHAEIVQQAAGIGIAPALIGAACGTVAAYLLRQTLASFLLGVTNIDMTLWVWLGVVVIASAALGALGAAAQLRRASPLDALRD